MPGKRAFALRHIYVYGSMIILCGCSVNRALIDPWSFAPSDPYCSWIPDSKGEDLRCTEDCPLLCPPDNQILSLAEVLDIALCNNPSTKTTWAEARQAAAAYGQAQSALLPALTGQYIYQRQRTPILSNEFGGPTTLVEKPFSQWGPQFTLTYTLLDFGQRRATSEAARYSLYFANYTHNRAIQTLLEDTTVDYYGLLYQQQLLEAFEADLATAQETYEAASMSLKQGVQDLSDQLQAMSQLLQAEIQLTEQKQAVVNARTELLSEMGLSANAVILLQKMPTFYPDQIPLACLENWIAIANEYRPDLLAARASLRSTEESLTAANRLWLPNVNYSLQFGRTAFSGGFQDKYDYTSTLSVSMPIFAGFWYRNNIRKAEAAQEISEANLREVQLKVVQEVVSAHSNVSVSLSSLKSSHRLLKVAEDQYRVAIAQYRAGTGIILEVISAQSTLFTARAQLAKSTQQWLVSLATLSYRAGTLSQPPPL